MEIPYTFTARPDTGLYNGKLGIWLFLASEVMLFGGLFSAYILLRVGTGFLSLAASGRLVAFEVDHIDPATDTAWSVLVRGLATLEGHPTDEELAAVAHPYVPRPGHQVLSIRPDVTTGRQFTISGPT